MRVIFDGKECLDEYERLLRSAKKRIWMCMYMIRFDETTKRLWRVLKEKRKEGVKVEVVYDLFGSARSVPRLAAEPFCRAFIPRPSLLGVRNHAKVFLIDDDVAVVSGRNLTRKYYHDWVDASIIIKEPQLLEELHAFAKHLGTRKDDPYTTWVRTTDPLVERRDVYNFVLEHIVTSTERIVIASPYFVIDDAIENLLLAAMDRGVEVQIVVPRKPEHHLAGTFNRINLQRIHHKRLTVKQSAKMFHSKVMLFDDVALVGSANFDNRSFKHNIEVSVIMTGRHLTTLRKHLSEVAHHSVRYNWIQRVYDHVLFAFTRHLMELL